MLYPYGSTFIFVLPAMLLAIYAQLRVSKTFEKFNKIPSAKGLTGMEVAKALLTKAGIYDVEVEHVKGALTDHYDPHTKVLRLSDEVYHSRSLAAIGIAAHETGHAIQHNESYIPLAIRGTLTPITNISSRLAMPLIFIGLFIASGSRMAGGSLGALLLQAGIALFGIVVLFQIITLPVEFNASKRAIQMLEDGNFLLADETPAARKVLNAAALTYVAAVAVSVSNMIRFFLMASNRR